MIVWLVVICLQLLNTKIREIYLKKKKNLASNLCHSIPFVGWVTELITKSDKSLSSPLFLFKLSKASPYIKFKITFSIKHQLSAILAKPKQ